MDDVATIDPDQTDAEPLDYGSTPEVLMRIPTPASFVTALLLGLPAIHGVSAQSGLARQGEAIVARDCAVCHAVDRQGLSQNRRAPPLRELPRRMPPEELRRELTTGITAGHPEMPRFRFSAGQVDAIMAYIQAIQDE